MGISIGNPITQAYTGSGAVPGSTDPDAIAFVTSASITNPPVQDAIYRLVYDLKSASLWDKINVAYPLVSNLGGAVPGGTYQPTNGVLNLATSSYTPPIYYVGTDMNTIGYGVVPSTASTTHSFYFEQDQPTPLTYYTLQADIKGLSQQKLKFEFDKSESIWGEESINAIFNILDGTISSTGSTTTASIQSLGESWYRLSITGQTSESVNAPSVGGFITTISASDITEYSQSTYTAFSVEFPALYKGLLLTNFNPIIPRGEFLTSSFCYNLKDPRPLTSSYFINFGGGVQFSAYGVESQTRNGYADTNFELGNILTTESYHISMYTRRTYAGIEVGVNNYYPIGVQFTDNQTGQVARDSAGGRWLAGNAINGIPSTASFEILTVTNNTGSVYNSGITLRTNNYPQHTIGLPDRVLTFLSRNYYSTDRLRFRENSAIPFSYVSFGLGLTEEEASAYSTIVERFQRALNRSMIL